MDVLFKKFVDMDDSGKIHLMKKVKGLVHPSYTALLPPDVKANIRGRKSAKIDKSTRRNKSAFEYIEFVEDIPSPLITCSDLQVTTTRRPKEEERWTQKIAPTLFDHPLVSDFPIGLRQYIGVKNVETDGNCGFRAIAGLMGFGEVDWRRVRTDLIEELGRYEDECAKLVVEDGRVNELYYTLSYCEAGRVDGSRWMTLPDMGHLIASCYNVIFVFLSTRQCLTFLPLRSPPASSFDRKIIAIGLVHGCHFVEVLQRLHTIIKVTWIRNTLYVERLIDELVLTYKEASLRKEREAIRASILPILLLLQQCKGQQFESAWAKHSDDSNITIIASSISKGAVSSAVEASN